MQHQSSIIERQRTIPPLYLPGQEVPSSSTSEADPHYWYIYLLIDPINRGPHYVGMTNNPPKRLYQHMYKPAPRVADWLEVLHVMERRPCMWLVDIQSSRSLALRAERRWMRICRNRGIFLTNARPRLPRRLRDSWFKEVLRSGETGYGAKNLYRRPKGRRRRAPVDRD